MTDWTELNEKMRDSAARTHQSPHPVASKPAPLANGNPETLTVAPTAKKTGRKPTTPQPVPVEQVFSQAARQQAGRIAGLGSFHGQGSDRVLSLKMPAHVLDFLTSRVDGNLNVALTGLLVTAVQSLEAEQRGIEFCVNKPKVNPTVPAMMEGGSA